MKSPNRPNAPSGGGLRDTHDLLDEIERAPYGPARTSLAERAVSLADAQGDTALAVGARFALVEAGCFGGAPEKALTAFTWLLAHADAHPGTFTQWKELLWRYKWIADSVRCFPHVKRDRIDRILDDMAHRYEHFGASLRPVYGLRATWAASRGDPREAARWREEWRRASRDSFSDCVACERARDLEHDLDAGDYEAAFHLASELVCQWVTCAEQPHETLPRLLVPLVRCGRLEEARVNRDLLKRLVGRNPEFLGTAGRHIEYLTVIGRLSAATNQLEQWLPEALRTYNLVARFSYLRGALVLIEALQQAGRKRVSLRLPGGVEPPVAVAGDGRFDLDALHGWALPVATELAERFDARNGTARFRRVLGGRAELHELAASLREEDRAAS